MTFIEANVLKLRDRVVIEKHYDSVIEYLSDKYPHGFGEKSCTISVNGIEVKIENYDVKLADDATVVLMFHPGIAIAGHAVLSFIANMLIASAVSYVVGQIFRPKMPELQTSLSSRNSAGKASSVYALNSQQNEAKIGAVIPIIYGKVRTYPSLICAPYYRFEENEEYLYQLMCIGQGTYDINKMFISDTDAVEIQSDYFRYEKLEYDDFKTVGGIASKVKDSNYFGLVKTIPDIDNLELRGTPINKSMTMRFSGSTITFFPYADGTVPDLSSLSSGSSITISESDSNNGVYTVDSVSGDVVTVQSHTFTLEPTDSTTRTLIKSDIDNNGNETKLHFYAVSDRFYLYDYYNDMADDNFDRDSQNSLGVGDGTVFSIQNIGDDRNFSCYNERESKYNGGTFVEPSPNDYFQDEGDVVLNFYAKTYKAEFETSYGSFSFNKRHIGFEVDIVYPNGIYNSDDTTGDFTARTTTSEIYVKNSNIDQVDLIVTDGKMSNSAVRVTQKFLYATFGHAAVQDSISLSFKRLTAEPNDVKSMDKTYISRVKFIMEDKDYESLGNVSLLWCKVRASNAISSIGQFAVNAWVTRNDVRNDVESVITDLYTSDVYGGRLPASDLDLDTTGAVGPWVNNEFAYAAFLNTGLYEVQQHTGYVYLSQVPPPVLTPFLGDDGNWYEIQALPTLGVNTAVRTVLSFDTVNGAIDSKMTLFDAMQMVGKSNRYTVFPVGGDVKLKYDGVKPIRTALYNETNMIKDSLKISYLFEESDETDSVKITYRDSSEFKEVTAIYPSDGIFPDELELWGCTDDVVASDMAKYLFKQDRARRKSIEFKTDVQGLIPQFLDRIAVSHNIPSWGTGGQIVAVSGDTITLDCDFDIVSSAFDTILFRDEIGGVSTSYSFSVISSREILLSSAAPAWLNTTEAFDNTFFSIGTVDSVVKDYIVTSVKPNGEQITISAVNYDESIYT